MVIFVTGFKFITEKIYKNNFSGLWEEKSEESVDKELQDTGLSLHEIQAPLRYESKPREKPQLSIDDYAYAAISAEKRYILQ